MAQNPSNHIKIGGSSKLSLSKGNITIGVKGTTEYGPSSDSGFYNGIVPTAGGYVIYVNPSGSDISAHAPKDDAECMLYLKKYGAPDGTISDMLSWALTQNNLLVVNHQLQNTSYTYQNVAGSDGDTGFFFGGFRGEGLLDLVKVGFLANGQGVTNAPVTAVDRVNQTITISGAQFVSGAHYDFTLDTATGGEPTPTPTPEPTSTPTSTPTPTPTPSARSGYYSASVLCDAVTGGTELTNAYFYVGANYGPMCDASSGGGDQISGLSAGTYYIYDVTNNKIREFTAFGGGAGNLLLNGSCSTPSCGGGGGRTGYYYSTTSSDAVTGGTQPTGLVFGYSSGDTMCNESVISIYANEFSGLTPGSYYIYDADANKVRSFTLYGSSNYGSMSGGCSTPAGGGARSGYWYATTRPAAITGGTQVGDVTFSGGDNTLCNGTSAISNSFSSLNGYIYIYNGDTGDVKTFYGSNTSSISSMGSCLNTNTPIYYYSTMSNDCYGNQTLTNVTFSGGSDFCSATGFSANELSSLAPNTYYMRDPFTDNFRSFYCAYNGSVSFSTSCTQYTCN